MYRKTFARPEALRFKRFTRRSFALFNCIGKEVIVCTLSVSSLTYAKADGISVKPLPSVVDTLGQKEVELDEVLVTGSKAPLTALQSAKIVSVITREDIHRAEAETINDILKLATGVDVRQRGGFGVQTDISINGGTFDQITILLNGLDISSPQTGHNAADFPVSLSDIERIEILEGAAARVFGSQAFSGAVNIVMRPDRHNSVRASVEAGSFGTFGGDAGITWHTSPHAAHKLSGGYTQSDGGIRHGDFKKRRAYYMGSMTSRCADLQWQAGLCSQDYGASTFYSSRFDNQYEATRRFMASATADIRPFADQRLVLTPSLFWHKDVDHYQLTRGMTGAAAGENYHRTDVCGMSLTAHSSWALGKTAVGMDMRSEQILSTAYGDALPENKWQDISGTDRMYDHKGKRTNTSLFLEHNVIVGGLTVSAGIMANCNTGLDRKFRFYPGVDISYRPDEHWKIYASWNKSLRVPSYTDLYTSNAAQQGDINLKPEKNSMFKLGARLRYTGFETTLSSFYSHGTDIIDWVYAEADSKKYHAMNIGRLNNMGWSADIALRPHEMLASCPVTRIKVGYAFIHQNHDTDRPVFGSLYALEYLRHKATVKIDHRIWRSLNASWTARWQQRMNGYSPYTKLDVRLAWDAESYSLYLKADNITCHRYYDVGKVLQPGLWIMAGGSVNIKL